MRLVDADELKRGIEALCKDERTSISAATYFALMAFINKMPTIEAETDYTGNAIIAGKPKDGWYVTIAKNFARYSIHESHIIKKTGRHFPQVAELLNAMKEDGETNA